MCLKSSTLEGRYNAIEMNTKKPKKTANESGQMRKTQQQHDAAHTSFGRQRWISCSTLRAAQSLSASPTLVGKYVAIETNTKKPKKKLQMNRYK